MHEPACCASSPVPDRAANDNSGAAWSEPLEAALRLFARTGVAAPQVAHDTARAAEAAGDMATASDWREVGRMFSPSAVSRNTAARSGRSTPTG
jgi:hypothetical protein